ncbi:MULTISPECIES: hypothetical protein [Bacteria]|jgi:hypothetical protein|nr:MULTISPECIES: hypothetical protein [Bacteria]MBR1038913.1 hypothetical protein [Bradyrhizobium viridifuturi]MCA3704567.1 hypothetical protein [Methylobacterium sp.]DAR98648.1 MAG TPA: hypothetical protein [Caudoviricetes sp.]MBR1075922.1 hypothetical protein [Bradyrhizobium viridifuturi]MCA3794674.1 hypothetical protein [Burkholderia sp.]
MNPTVYIDGRLADHIGAIGLREIANRVSTLALQPVDVMTHGESRYHSDKRITGAVEAKKA